MPIVLKCYALACDYVVPLSEQITPCAWCVELPPSYETYSVLVLQEHLSLCH